MKALLFTFRLYITFSLLLTFITSCETGKGQMDSTSNFDQYVIRYESNDNQFVSINQSQLKNFVINQFELEEGQEIQFIKVVDEIGNEHIKVHMANKIGNKSEFAIFIQSMNEKENGKNTFLIEDKICACTTCLEGCELKINNKRCACICPEEESPCTKTEKAIVEGNYKTSDFEG